MSRTWVDVAAVEWSDCGGGRGNAGIRSSNLGKNMTKTPKPETESDLEREYHRNRSRKRKNSKQLNLPYGNLIIMNLKNSTQRIELGEPDGRSSGAERNSPRPLGRGVALSAATSQPQRHHHRLRLEGGVR